MEFNVCSKCRKKLVELNMILEDRQGHKYSNEVFYCQSFNCERFGLLTVESENNID